MILPQKYLFNNTMPIKGYRPPDKDRVTTPTDVLDDLPMRHAKEDLLPMIAQKTRNAINVVPIYIEYFQRLKTGRRCSCFGVEADPTGLCPVCFGTGVVGGYNKRGTKTEIFDVTHPNVVTTNIQAEYGAQTRPIYWSLIDTAVYGTIEFSIPINSNIGLIDVFDISDYKPTGTDIQYFIRSENEVDFVELTRTSIEERLKTSFIHFLIVMKRKTPSTAVPKLQLIRFSYRLLRLTGLRADIPRRADSLTLEEFGIYESFSTQSFALDNTLKNCTTEDFIINLQDNTRWKVTEVKNNNPLNIILSWDLVCRKIQDFEPYAKVPEGLVDTSMLPAQFIRSIQTDKNITETQNLNPGHLRLPGHTGSLTSVDQKPVGPGIADVGNPRRET